MRVLHRRVLLSVLVLAGCNRNSANDDDAADAEPTPEPIDCTAANSLPVSFETVPNIVSAEDFVFGLEGEVLSVDPQGTLVRSMKDGENTVLVPGVVGSLETGGSAGISMLPGGDVVIADVGAGALLRVTLEGGRETILSGLAYPNGVEVHRDGWVVVAENDTGQVRRVDPQTGEFTILATGLFAPNGVTFSPDYETLYIGSFGGGTVHSLVLSEDGTDEEPVEFGNVDEFTKGSGGGPPPWGWSPWTTACAGLAAGADCTLVDQAGVCVNDGGQLYCEAPDPFLLACEGVDAGGACTLLEEVGVCEDWGFGMYCSNKAWWGEAGEGGGLDGIATDACGNVYVTEFTSGRVFRWTAEGDGPEVVVTLPSWWIPNMDFGTGLGGWNETLLWVNTRDTDEMYGLDIGLPGRRAAHLP